MLEWLKRHAWKACIRQKRIGGSNPPLSAKPKVCLVSFVMKIFICPIVLLSNCLFVSNAI